MAARIHGRLALAMVLVALVAGCAATPQTRQLLQSPPPIPAHHEIEAAPFFAQRDYQCGPAALATVLTHSGVNTTPEQLVSQVYVPELKGSLQVEMLAAAARHDRLAIQLDGNLNSLLREVADDQPVLVMQNLGLSAYPFWHYAVVIGYDLQQQEIMLRSGEIERLVRPLAVFERTWQRAGHWAMVTAAPDVVPTTATEPQFLRAVLMHETPSRLAVRLRAYRAGLARWPNSFELAMGLGNSLYANGDFEQAEAAFQRATTVRPDRPEAWNNLAYALQRQGRTQQALSAVKRAIALDSANPEYQDSLRELQSSIEG